MHIAIDASRAINIQKTGVEHYARQIITYLIEYVKLAANNPLLAEEVQRQAAALRFTLYCREQPDGWLQELDNYDFVEVKQLRWPANRLWTQGRLSLEMATRQPDVLFVPASALPLLAARTTVTTIHDVGFMAYPERFAPRERQFLTWSTRRALRKASTVITVSEFSKQEILKYFGEQYREKITVIPLGVDLDRFGSVSAEVAKRKLATVHGADRPYLLFVGRLERKKNIAGVIETFRIFKETYGTDHALVLVGAAGYGWEEAAALVGRYGLDDHVIRPGYVPNGDLPYWYAAADALLFPSFYEGFGLPVLEAMAAGVPVVASTAGSLPEIAGEAALVAAPDDYAALAAHVHTAVGDKTQRARLVAAGSKRAAQFAWERSAERTFSTIIAA